MNFDPDSYSLTIRKEKVDGDYYFVGRVAELPNVRAFEATFDEAREVLIDAITSLYEVAKEKNLPFPAPRQEEVEYSGRITLRLTKSLHRQAVAQAEAEDVSLNHFLSMAIAQHIGQTSMLSAMTGRSGLPQGAATGSNVLRLDNAPTGRTAITEVSRG